MDGKGIVKPPKSREATLARHLRAETAMTLRWVADRLWMGSWTYVLNRLREHNEYPFGVNSED
jgi:hypothetical protein